MTMMEKGIMKPIVASFACAVAAASPADVVLDAASEIVLAADAPSATRLAAEELGFFLKGVFGRALPVVTARTPGKTAILLGGPVPDGLGTDAARIEAKDGAVRIAGVDDDPPDVAKTAFLADEAPWQTCFRRGTLFGVYDFLERHAGVRMYFPGELGTVVPKAERLVVPEGIRVAKPVFTVRRYGFADGKMPPEVLAAVADVATKDRHNTPEMAARRLHWHRLRMETRHVPCCHGARWHHLLERFRETHPEFFMLAPKGDGTGYFRDTTMPQGTRRHVGHLCHTSAVWEEIYRDARAYFAGESAASRGIPGGRWGLNTSGNWFDLMPQDGMSPGRRCRCESCARYFGSSRHCREDLHFASELIWKRTCEVARRLKDEGFANARVTQMAYQPYGRVPTFDIPDNVDVMVARRGPWGEVDRALQDRENAEVKAWADKLGRKVWLWNYPDKVACWNLLMPDVPQLAPRAWASYYTSVRPWAFGAFAESESDRWLYNYLNYYVFSRVCWDADADVEAILAEHHRLMFGAAAPEMAAFFDLLEKKWTHEVAGRPVDSPLGPGVVEAPTQEELETKVYSPEVIRTLDAALASAAAKLAKGSLEARRVSLFRREFLEPLARRYGGSAVPRLQVGILSDVHVTDRASTRDFRRALKLFDERRADAVLMCGDITDHGTVSQLREAAAAWDETFPDGCRTDGRAIARLFHYGDHDTHLNARARKRFVTDAGLDGEFIPRVGPSNVWEDVWRERYEPIGLRQVKGYSFVLCHHRRGPQKVNPVGNNTPGLEEFLARAKLPADRPFFFSQHRIFSGTVGRTNCNDQIGWDDGTSTRLLSRFPNCVAFCGHGHIPATSDASLWRGAFTAVAVPSLFYSIETWVPKVKVDNDKHQALFMKVYGDRIAIERLDVTTGTRLADDWVIPLRAGAQAPSPQAPGRTAEAAR